jgi:hypothetical protein
MGRIERMAFAIAQNGGTARPPSAADIPEAG